MDEQNRYAPPKAALDGMPAPTSGEAPTLWNPNAAANWCLLFTPIFGSWLHVMNWEALGMPEKARTARLWRTASIVIIAVYVLATMVAPRSPAIVLSRLVVFVLLVSWYFASARPQARFVAQRYGSAYPRRGWAYPLAIAMVVYVAYFAMVLIVVAARGSA